MIGLAIYSCHCLYKAAMPSVRSYLAGVKEQLPRTNAETWLTMFASYQLSGISNKQLIEKMHEVDASLKMLLPQDIVTANHHPTLLPWLTFLSATIGVSCGYALMPRRFVVAGGPLTFAAGATAGILGTTVCLYAPVAGAGVKDKVVALMRPHQEESEEETLVFGVRE